MQLVYKNEEHEAAFKTFVEEAYMTLADLDRLSDIERRQFAFLYLIAMYQEAYEKYEGERFYVEALEDITLGGPTYLLEDYIGEMNRPHERILVYAKRLLKNEPLEQEEAWEDAKWTKQALKIAEKSAHKHPTN